MEFVSILRGIIKTRCQCDVTLSIEEIQSLITALTESILTQIRSIVQWIVMGGSNCLNQQIHGSIQ